MSEHPLISYLKAPSGEAIGRLIEETADRLLNVAYQVCQDRRIAQSATLTVYRRVLMKEWRPEKISDSERHLVRLTVKTTLAVLRTLRAIEEIDRSRAEGRRARWRRGGRLRVPVSLPRPLVHVLRVLHGEETGEPRIFLGTEFYWRLQGLSLDWELERKIARALSEDLQSPGLPAELDALEDRARERVEAERRAETAGQSKLMKVLRG